MGDYNNITYEDMRIWNLQYELFDEDFNDCSGYLVLFTIMVGALEEADNNH